MQTYDFSSTQQYTDGHYWVKLGDDMPWEVAVYAEQFPGWFVMGQSHNDSNMGYECYWAAGGV